jgi:hypothetical protein
VTPTAELVDSRRPAVVAQAGRRRAGIDWLAWEDPTRRFTVLRTPLVLAAAVAALIAGCSSGSDELSATAQWADGVCTARTDLQQSVAALDDSLTFTPGSGSALEDAKTQVSDRVEAVKESASGLKSAIEEIPADSDGEISAAQAELKSAAADVEAGLSEVGSAAASATSAGSASEFITALTEVTTAAAATKNSVARLGDQLSGYAQSGSEQVQQAFSEAPACQTS